MTKQTRNRIKGRLQKFKDESKMSYKEMSEQMGVSLTQLCQWTKGNVMPNEESKKKINDFLNKNMFAIEITETKVNDNITIQSINTDLKNSFGAKNEWTSLELVKVINSFRALESNRVELQHKSFLAIIRDEFSDEITGQKILLSEYKDVTGRLLPMYILTLSQAKQVLERESKTVRRAVISYLEMLESELQQNHSNIELLPSENDVITSTVNHFIKLALNTNNISEKRRLLGKAVNISYTFDDSRYIAPFK